MRLYRKKECEFCQLSDSYQSFPINDKFYWRLCKEHGIPIVIYKYHNEPSDKDVKEVLEWAKRKFPYLVPNFKRKHNPKHYSFELERKEKLEFKMEKNFVLCSVCEKLVPIDNAVEIDGEYYCTKCLPNVHDNLRDSDYELYQIIDEDDYDDW